MEAFDFAPQLIEANAFLNEKYWREVMTDGCWDTVNMTSEELEIAIIGDILGATMWEIQTQKSLSFDWNQLVLFIPIEKERFRIKEHLDRLIETHQVICIDGQLRIDVNRLQETMDHVGNWYTGYVMPNGEKIVSVNRDVFTEMLKSHGNIETMVKSLTMEMTCSHQSLKTVQ